MIDQLKIGFTVIISHYYIACTCGIPGDDITCLLISMLQMMNIRVTNEQLCYCAHVCVCACRMCGKVFKLHGVNFLSTDDVILSSGSAATLRYVTRFRLSQSSSLPLASHSGQCINVSKYT
jgi:hypothetical protein